MGRAENADRSLSCAGASQAAAALKTFGMPKDQEESAVSRLAEADHEALWNVGALGEGVAERHEISDDEALHP